MLFFRYSVENLAVEIEADLVDGARLFAPEYVACPADLKIAKRDLISRPKARIFFERIKAIRGALREQLGLVEKV